MHAPRKFWNWLAVICVMLFAVLGWAGTKVCLAALPIFKQVASTQGAARFSKGPVQRSQKAWLSAGGQQLGLVWGRNIGLGMMVFISLVPAGICQAWASVAQGLRHARSAEFVDSLLMATLVGRRLPGDIVFAVGTGFLAWFAARLLSGSRQKPAQGPAGVTKRA